MQRLTEEILSHHPDDKFRLDLDYPIIQCRSAHEKQPSWDRLRTLLRQPNMNVFSYFSISHVWPRKLHLFLILAISFFRQRNFFMFLTPVILHQNWFPAAPFLTMPHLFSSISDGKLSSFSEFWGSISHPDIFHECSGTGKERTREEGKRCRLVMIWVNGNGCIDTNPHPIRSAHIQNSIMKSPNMSFTARSNA